MEAVSVSLKDRNRFVVAFTGFNGKLMMPIDRFMTRADMADYSQVIVSDPSRGLSMCGHGGRFANFHGFMSFLRTTIGDPQRLVVTGTSTGTFAALLCGHLLEADVVTAFSPFTCIEPERLAELGDAGAFVESFPLLDAQAPDVRALYDLRDVLDTWNGRTAFHLHYARESKQFPERAQLLEGMPHVHMTAHPYDSPWFTRNLVTCGLLHKCFDASQLEVFDAFYQRLPVLQRGGGTGGRGAAQSGDAADGAAPR